MIIRQYTDKDLDACREIHAKQGFQYDFPNLQSPLYFIKLVGEQDGKVVQAAFAKVTAEIYFMQNGEWATPQERMVSLLALQDVGRELAYKPGGLEELLAFLPPPIEKRFGKRLMAHGWKKAPWQAYYTGV